MFVDVVQICLSRWHVAAKAKTSDNRGRRLKIFTSSSVGLRESGSRLWRDESDVILAHGEVASTLPQGSRNEKLNCENLVAIVKDTAFASCQ